MSLFFEIIFLLLVLFAVRTLYNISLDINSIRQDVTNYYLHILDRDQKNDGT